MKKTARWHEASLMPKLDQGSASLSLDVTLQERIRSLLLSRNEKRPPTTPSPSPDLVYLSYHPIKTPIGNSLAPPRTHRFSLIGSGTRQESLDFLSGVMGATRFDGPAGQFDEGDSAHGRRGSTNAGIHSDRVSLLEDRSSSTASGVNHNSQGDLIGRDMSVAGALPASKYSSAKRPAIPRTPQISYTLRTVAPNTPKINDGRDLDREPISPGLGDLESDKNQHHHHGPPGSAVDALHNIQGHNARVNHITPSSIQPKHSRDATISTIPTSESQNLLKGFSDLGSTNAKEEGPGADLRKFSVGEPNEESMSASMQEPSPHFGGAQLEAILADLPPINDNPSTVLSKHSISLDVDELAESSEASLLPKNPSREDEQISKSSPVSRALSILSSVSAKSGLRNLQQSSTNKENHIAADKFDQSTTMKRSVLPHSEHDESRWYQPIVGRRSSVSLGSSNLTTRPSQRKKSAAAPRSKLQTNTESADDASAMRRQQQTSESFQKVIVDLESLLKEALDIAGRASRENSEADPALPREMRIGYNRLSSTTSDDPIPISGPLDDEENQHGQNMVMEPDEEDLYNGRSTKARDPSLVPRSLTMTRSHSAVPPLDTHDIQQNYSTISIEGSQTASLAPDHHHAPLTSTDWALVQRPARQTPKAPTIPMSSKVPSKEQHSFLIRDHGLTSEASGNTHNSHERPQIQTRVSSRRLQKHPAQKHPLRDPAAIISSEESESTSGPYVADFKNSGLQYHPVYREAMAGESSGRAVDGSQFKEDDDIVPPLRPTDPPGREQGRSHPTNDEIKKGYSLRGRHHFEIREPHGFSLSRSHRRAPLARDWGKSRKRFVATITCLNTALMGLIIGVYAGEVPAIQYAVADDHHVVILGNVVFFLGLAVTTALFWPLPLLHGRKPYTMAALTILLPLLFPQALAINGSRNPYVATYRIGLLVPRAFAGLAMGFANMNFKATLLDLFGASLQSGSPHQEVVDEHDVRRHGGGMGVWLGIWTWCWIGSIGVGFWIGASIISGLQVSWGFWILIILTSSVLLLNVLTPEVRRSAYRRSMAEVRSGTDVSRRIARGEIKMHLDSTGPLWWWEEVWAGHVLCIRMLRQPGFAVLAFYLGWIYGQVVLVIVVSENRSLPKTALLTIPQLLGALLSKYYYFHPQYVGLSIAIIPLGALLATPFQKASIFSRSRYHKQRTDSMTFEKRVTWTSHLVRRSIFMIILPFAGMAYTLASHGPPTHFMVPIIFAGVIGFLSNLAIAECNGIIMETFDTSDLQPGMTGRPRHVLPEEIRKKRTNFSCFPRVTAGFAIAQSISFCIAAAVTGWGGVIERYVGAQTATAVMAGVLLVLTLLLIAVLTRYKSVQVVPSARIGTNILSGPEDEWKAVIIGHPSGTTRRVSLLELGTLSRWTEIRRRNRLGTGF